MRHGSEEAFGQVRPQQVTQGTAAAGRRRLDRLPVHRHGEERDQVAMREVHVVEGMALMLQDEARLQRNDVQVAGQDSELGLRQIGEHPVLVPSRRGAATGLCSLPAVKRAIRRSDLSRSSAPCRRCHGEPIVDDCQTIWFQPMMPTQRLVSFTSAELEVQIRSLCGSRRPNRRRAADDHGTAVPQPG